MTEGKEGSNRKDLTEFEDYLSEFDSLINFDSENCPICGIELPQNTSIPNTAFVLYKSIGSESKLKLLIDNLDTKKIIYRIVKRLNTEVINEVSYIFDVMIPLNCLSKLDK
jgi:hypothetical protein